MVFSELFDTATPSDFTLVSSCNKLLLRSQKVVTGSTAGLFCSSLIFSCSSSGVEKTECKCIL